MTYISILVRYLICQNCKWCYDPNLTASTAYIFLQPKYEMGADGNWHYFCPICGGVLTLVF